MLFYFSLINDLNKFEFVKLFLLVFYVSYLVPQVSLGHGWIVVLIFINLIINWSV